MVLCVRCHRENKELRICDICGRSLCSHCILEAWGEFHYCQDCEVKYSNILTNQTPENYEKLKKIAKEKERKKDEAT